MLMEQPSLDVEAVKGTASRGMEDRALFGDEPQIVFIFICCFLVFNFEFYFLQRCCKKVVRSYVMGQPSILSEVVGSPVASL
jgi:hypothetical protein